MALIEVRKLTKIYPGGVDAVSEVSLDVEEGETMVLIGTSGSGKTTLMKMINRLIEPTSGEIYIDGRNIRAMNPIELRREIGYVIQKIGLFPHMTIEDNISIVPRLLGWSREKQHQQASELLEMVGMEPDPYLHRYPNELSGGQQQRIGVARALAGDPPIVLMDEPFGALDPITREQLQEEFRQLKERIRKTIIFVTHDIFEAVNLADRMAIMDSGRVLQVDPPERVLTRPADEFVARFLGKHRFQLEMSTVLVKDVMDEEPATIRLTSGRQTVARAVELMRRRRVTSLFAVNGDRRLVGVLRAGALRRASADAELSEFVEQKVPTIGQDADLLSAVHVMANSDYTALPVPDAEGKLVGVLTASSLTGVFSDGLRGNGATSVSPQAPEETGTPPDQAGEDAQR